MSTTVFIIYVLLSLFTIGMIIYYGRRPTKSISWVLAVIALPFAGPILYYLFGVNRRKFRFFNKKEFQRRKQFMQSGSSLTDKFRASFSHDSRKQKMNALITENSGTATLKGNSISILQDGDETFDALFEAMANAKKFIHVQYYILEKGIVLEKLLKLFKTKIDEGVEVRILYDSFGSYGLKGSLKKRFKKIGAKIHPLMPIRLGNLLFFLNYRNHRKIVVIDNQVAFTGGVNISDKYITNSTELGKWKDTHLRIEGPLVNDLHLIFLKDYFFATKKDDFMVENYLSEQSDSGGIKAQVVAGGPDSNQPVIMQQYMGMINQAHHQILIANPYFLPGVAFLQALKIAVQQNIEVRLLVPCKSDSKAALFAMFSQFEELLALGVKIFLRKDFSHSKILIIDDDMMSIGSGNFDNRSFEHNYETNILLYDEGLTTEVTNEFLDLCKKAEQLELDKFQQRPRWKKFLEGFSKFFKPLL